MKYVPYVELVKFTKEPRSDHTKGLAAEIKDKILTILSTIDPSLTSVTFPSPSKSYCMFRNGERSRVWKEKTTNSAFKDFSLTFK